MADELRSPYAGLQVARDSAGDPNLRSPYVSLQVVRLRATLRPPGHPITITPGSPAILKPGLVFTDGFELTLAAGAPLVYAIDRDIFAAGHALNITPGSPALATTSMGLTGHPITITPGLISLQSIKPPGHAITITPGAPSLSSPLRVLEGHPIRMTPGSPYISATAQGYGLYVNSINVGTQWSMPAGFDLAHALNGQGSMTFTLYVNDGAHHTPTNGEEVKFYLGTDLVFGGYIEEIITQAPVTVPATIFYICNVTPYSGLLRRRVVYGYYGGPNNNRSLGFAASSLTVRFLEGDFIDYQGPFPVSGEGPEYIAPMSAQEAMNKIASAAGVMWDIDVYRQLRFITAAAGLEAAPHTVDNAAVFIDSRELTETAGEYRNATFVSMSSSVAEFTEDTRPAIALALFPENSVFYTTFPVDSLPTITAHGSLGSVTLVDVIVGPLIPAFAWDAFYQPGTSSVTLNRTAPWDAAVGTLDRVEITYQIANGVAPFVVVKDATAIEARRVAEGGLTSGQYDSVENETDIESRDEAIQLATALNAYYSESGALPLKGSFSSDLAGWRPGQIAVVDWPDMGVNSLAFLIESVSMSEVDASLAADPPFLRSKVTISRNGSEVARKTQRVRADRPKASVPLIFMLAKTLDGSVNVGAIVGTTKPPHVVRQRGVLVSAAIVWEFGTRPTGADFILTVEHATAEDPQTWVPIGTLTTPDGSQDASVTLNTRVEVNDLIRLDITQVGSEEPGRDGLVHIREAL